MRRVASELGAATLSLYRHVEDKDDLVRRMLDAVLRDVRLPATPPAGWRPRVEIAAGSCGRPAAGTRGWPRPCRSRARSQWPAGCRWPSSMLAALDDLDLDHQTTLTAYITLVSLVRGLGMNLELEAEAQAATGVDSEEWLAAQEPRLRAIVEAGGHPVFARYVSQEYDFNLDELFEFGLGRLLDGLAALLPPTRAPIESGA